MTSWPSIRSIAATVPSSKALRKPFSMNIRTTANAVPATEVASRRFDSVRFRQARRIGSRLSIWDWVGLEVESEEVGRVGRAELVQGQHGRDEAGADGQEQDQDEVGGRQAHRDIREGLGRPVEARADHDGGGIRG